MFEAVFDVCKETISTLGYPGIFVLMVLESMIFPVPSEAVMPFAGFLAAQGRFSMLGVALASSMGSLVGSYLSYIIGLYGGRAFLAKYGKFFLLDQHHLELTENFFAKHGESTIFISRFIPVVRHLISIPAGTAKMNLSRFLIFTVVGATAWNMFLAWLGVLMQEKWDTIKSYTHYIDYFVVACLLAAIVYFVFIRLKTKQKIEETKI